MSNHSDDSDSVGQQSTMTPETAKFRSQSPSVQRRLLCDYPHLLARVMHGYSRGADCEALVRHLLEGAAPLMCVQNSQGDSPIASALVRGQADRASWLANLAAKKNPSALTNRTRHRETLLMLSTTTLPDGLLESLLERDPSELYRPYDSDGRNLLHHCALEDSAKAVDIVLRCIARLMAEGRLEAANVEQAVHMNDRRGDTPVHLMALRNQQEMMRLLLSFASESGACIDLDTRRHVGSRWTPLMAAVNADAAEAVEFLVDNGADMDETDAEGRSVAELASETGQPRVTALLTRLQRDTATMSMALAGPLDAVDSGIHSVPTLVRERQQQKQQPQQCPVRHPDLSREELEALESRLLVNGKSGAFLAAVSRLSNGQFAEGVLLSTDKPLMTAFSLWSHVGPVPLELVRRALVEVGEAAAAD